MRFQLHAGKDMESDRAGAQGLGLLVTLLALNEICDARPNPGIFASN